jgi:hypothetical protein
MPLWLADLIATVHFGLVLFALLGAFVPLMVALGEVLQNRAASPRKLDGRQEPRSRGPLGRLAENFWFRSTHLGYSAFVGFSTLVGWPCPLTVWEMQLREMGGVPGQRHATFLGQWVERILYVEMEASVLNVLYLVFTGLVVANWFLIPPRWPSQSRGTCSPAETATRSGPQVLVVQPRPFRQDEALRLSCPGQDASGKA